MHNVHLHSDVKVVPLMLISACPESWLPGLSLTKCYHGSGTIEKTKDEAAAICNGDDRSLVELKSSADIVDVMAAFFLPTCGATQETCNENAQM